MNGRTGRGNGNNNGGQDDADDDESTSKGYDEHGPPPIIPAHAEAELGDIGKSHPLSDHGEGEKEGYKTED